MKQLYPNSILKILLLAALFSVAANAISRAQPQITAEQLATMQPLDPAAIPGTGTFWLLKGPNPGHGGSPPFPCPPGNLPGVPIYQIGAGQFLVDDSAVDYSSIGPERALSPAFSSMEAQNDDVTTSPMGSGSYNPVDLWLELPGVSNDLTVATTTANLIIHEPQSGYSTCFTSSIFGPVRTADGIGLRDVWRGKQTPLSLASPQIQVFSALPALMGQSIPPTD